MWRLVNTRGWVGGLILLCSLFVPGRAQDAVTAAVPEASTPLPVMHVYTDLLQIPVLVLDRSHQRLKTPAAENRFSVSLAGGAWFHPVHVRQEGEDPISMSILLDMHGFSAQLMPKVDEAIKSLGMGPLHPQDTVVVYALDCQLATAGGRIAPDPASLKDAVDRLMSASAERRATTSNCKRGDHLWDTLLALTTGMQNLPGRRIILAISDGEDSGSQHKWRDVAELAQMSSVTVFGESYRRTRSMSFEEPFPTLCELSGGLDRVPTDSKLNDELGWVASAIRERYIVEFPRPVNSIPGRHHMAVSLQNGSDLFVRPAGITFPRRSDTELNDPATIKNDLSRLPTLGNQRPLPAAR